MEEYLDKLFPQFESSLKDFIVSTLIHVKAGEIMLRTGQYIKSTMLIVDGRVKLYRQGDMVVSFLCIT